jgi:LacI family gluconate utilization system Gnt-I transcriptional repressor
MLNKSNVPIVEIMDVDGDPIQHCVGISHQQAGRGMAQQLLKIGYRNIAFIGTKMPKDFRAQKRFDGFKAALSNAGVTLVAQELYLGASSIQTGRNLTATLLAARPDVDCIYYSSDVMSVGGLMHCLAAGLSVPGDLALAGFNNLEILNGMPMRLATTDAHRFGIGAKAAELILNHGGKGVTTAPQMITLTPTIEPGETI